MNRLRSWSTTNRKSELTSSSLEGIAEELAVMKAVLHDGRIIRCLEAFLGGDILHFDNIWFRSIASGLGTVPHWDIVLLGTGTHVLHTCWVPWGDIDQRMGGLMVLENSLDHEEALRPYLQRDIDEYCLNRPLPEGLNLQATYDNKALGAYSMPPEPATGKRRRAL